jgi:formamidopyrimidine-DNA glycosylase
MPELPEVEIVMRGMEAALGCAEITQVVKNRDGLRTPFPKNLERLLKGRVIVNYARRAKYVVLTLDDKSHFLFHLGMSGYVDIKKNGETYQAKKHDHLVIHFKTGQTLALNDARRFGAVYYVPTGDEFPMLAHLGPEPLGNEFHTDYLVNILARKQVAIKIAIMDQKVVVGVGNIYASEALYEAGIDPRREAHTVTREELERLVVAIQQVLRRAIEAGGSTLKDYRQADGALGYFQHQFKVYGRVGKPCERKDCKCHKKEGIVKITQGGRATFFCPYHQK